MARWPAELALFEYKHTFSPAFLQGAAGESLPKNWDDAHQQRLEVRDPQFLDVTWI